MVRYLNGGVLIEGLEISNFRLTNDTTPMTSNMGNSEEKKLKDIHKSYDMEEVNNNGQIMVMII